MFYIDRNIAEVGSSPSSMLKPPSKKAALASAKSVTSKISSLKIYYLKVCTIVLHGDKLGKVRYSNNFDLAATWLMILQWLCEQMIVIFCFVVDWCVCISIDNINESTGNMIYTNLNQIYLHNVHKEYTHKY